MKKQEIEAAVQSALPSNGHSNRETKVSEGKVPVANPKKRMGTIVSPKRKWLAEMEWTEEEEISLLLYRHRMMWVVLLFVFGSVVPQIVYGQYSPEAQKIKGLSEQYDQRGYMKGQTISVDGNLVVSNSTGVPSYSYPISSFTSNGHAVGVTLNYAGSVSFTSFHKYSDQTVENPMGDSWSKYHQTRPAWLLGVNGFAVQALGFAGTMVNDPAYMKRLENPNVGAEYTDKNFVWLMDGYDFSNRMSSLIHTQDNGHDVIRILRSDGSQLELHNATSHDDLSGGSSIGIYDKRLYVGDYYVNEMNQSGYGRVEYDSAYIKPNESWTTPWRKPRLLRYYPGDGLEYVFREFCLPYGIGPYRALWTNDRLGSSIYGGQKAGATIFYLDEVNDGSQRVLEFRRNRHKPEEQMSLRKDSLPTEDNTRGRALCTGFTGHEILYGGNSMVIEALGRSTRVFFSTVGSGSAYKYRDSLNQYRYSDMFTEAGEGAEAMNTVTSLPHYGHRSWLGFVTAIVDPEGRETRFEYEKYKRKFENIGFPHHESTGEKRVELENWRLKRVIEPSVVQDLSYYGSLDTTLVAGAGLLEPNNAWEKWTLKYTLNPTVHEAKRYARNPTGGNPLGALLHTQEFLLWYTIPSRLDFPQPYNRDNWVSSIHITDGVTGAETWENQHYHVYEFLTHERLLTVPFTQLYASESIAGNEYHWTETHYKKLDTLMIQPVLSLSMARTGSSGPYIVKSATRMEYDTTTVREYPSRPSVQQYLGRELSQKRQYMLNPTDTSQVLLVNQTEYLHLGLYDTTMVLRQRTWNKFAALAAYFALVESNVQAGISKTQRWEEFLLCEPVFDTVEASQRRYFPPVYNLERRQVVKDAGGSVLQGIGRRYALGYTQNNTSSVYRGALLADTAFGADGAQYVANTYTYYGGLREYERELLATKTNANGAVEKYLYEYPCGQPDRAGVLRRNDNSDSTAYLYERNGLKEYESPLGTEVTVRKYVNGGGEHTETLRTLQERTYFDQVSATIDANGWYSKYAYDKNGRLQMAWLPLDFQGDSLYETRHYGSKNVYMSGYTRHYRWMDTVDCLNGWHINGPLEWEYIGRFSAGLPRMKNPCATIGGAAPGKQEQVLNNARKQLFENGPRDLGYCTGVYSEEIEKAVSLDSARLVLNVAKVQGRCVSFRVSVVVPHLSFFTFSLLPKFDTLLTRVYVLNCPEVAGHLSSKSAKRDGSVVLSGTSTDLYKELKIDLQSIRNRLLSDEWFIEIAVETPGAAVEMVNSGDDWRARLELVGTFREVDELADYTLKYNVLDQPGHDLRAIMQVKIDDSLHTASSVGMSTSPTDNSRYKVSQVRFGGDYRALSSIEHKHTGAQAGGTTWQDSVQMVYTGLGKPQRTTDELGDTTRTEYDDQGRVIKQYDADGRETRYSYSFDTPAQMLADATQNFYGFCSRKHVEQNNGNQNNYFTSDEYYDAFDRLRRQVDAIGNTTKYEYDVLGRLTEVINPAGDTTRYWYDNFGRVQYKYQPDMGYTGYGYDALGQVRFAQTEQQNNEGKVTFTEYDDLGRVTLVGEARLAEGSGGGGGKEIGGFGKKEQVQSGKLKLGRLVEQLHGEQLHDGGISSGVTANKTVSLVPSGLPSFWPQSELSGTSCAPYGVNGQVRVPYLVHSTEVHDDPGLPRSPMNRFENIAEYPENARMAIEYDWLPRTGGAVWRYFPPRNQWENLMPYGAARNLKGHEAAVAYRGHAGEPYHFVVMSYDERGRVEALVRSTEALGFEAVYYQYNSMNLVTQVRVADALRQHVVWYGYNQSGKVDTVWSYTTPSGQGLDIGSSARYVAAPAKPANAEIVYTYTKRWQVAAMKYPRIATDVQYAYNARRFLDSMVAQKSGLPLFRQVLQYDDLGRIRKQKSQHTGQAERGVTYLYDKQNFLRSAWEELEVKGDVYSYDAVGNRLQQWRVDNSQVVETGNHLYQSGIGKNRLTSMRRIDAQLNPIDTTFYSYNASGAMQSRTRGGVNENFFYDNIQGIVKRYNNVNGTIIGEWRYRYSASGEREQKREHLTQGVNAPKRWSYYLLGADNKQLALYEGHEVEQPTCGYFATPSTPQLFISASEYLSYGLGDVHNITARPIDPLKSWNEYKIQDHLGNTRVVVDEGNNVVGQYDYSPFGEVLWQSAPTSRLSFIDKEKDAENGLGDFGVRKYDDALGRFTSIDPLWEKYRSLTPYHYSANNPMILKDPSGLAIDVSNEEFNDSQDGTTNVKDLVGELESKTGLSLAVKNGRIVVTSKNRRKDAKGNYIGSAEAAKILTKAIKTKDVINVSFTDKNGSKVPDNDPYMVVLDLNQIQSNQNGVRNGLNSGTLGLALTFLHEVQHTNPMGALEDPPRTAVPTATGPVVDRMNKVRAQLGSDYGQRASYRGFDDPGNPNVIYMPFSPGALQSMQQGVLPTNEYYIQLTK